MERRRTEEEGADYKLVRRGWCLGSEDFRKELLAAAVERVGASHYGSERQESGEQKAERTVMEEMKRLGWDKGDLQGRRKGEGGDGAPAEERNDHELEVDSTKAADGQLDLCLKPSA